VPVLSVPQCKILVMEMDINYINSIIGLKAIAPNSLVHDDCLEAMKLIPDKSIDSIICDLPYGVTQCKWDTVIPFDLLWEQYKRIIKPNGAIALFGSQPFTSALVMSNPKWFRYEWIWDKKLPSGMQIAKYRPMQRHENVTVFSCNSPKYNPLMTEQKARTGRVYSKSDSSPLKYDDGKIKEYNEKYPQSIIEFYKRDNNSSHPTQKPVKLYRWLLHNYAKPNQRILDTHLGSGSHAIAAHYAGVHLTAFEIDTEYFHAAKARIERETAQTEFFTNQNKEDAQ